MSKAYKILSILWTCLAMYSPPLFGKKGNILLYCVEKKKTYFLLSKKENKWASICSIPTKKESATCAIAKKCCLATHGILSKSYIKSKLHRTNCFEEISKSERSYIVNITDKVEEHRNKKKFLQAILKAIEKNRHLDECKEATFKWVSRASLLRALKKNARDNLHLSPSFKDIFKEDRPLGPQRFIYLKQII